MPHKTVSLKHPNGHGKARRVLTHHLTIDGSTFVEGFYIAGQRELLSNKALGFREGFGYDGTKSP
ncbi:MAG: hypothetical protein EHM70_22405 [Chloroflexota bacterium]|nr:MAG: hypothetical protein EHM70_22405 [Chloroflexota bacterium]